MINTKKPSGKLGTGQSCRLVDAAPPYLTIFHDGSETVKVTTTDTSVKFTVSSNDYFAAPGSTIEFRTVERKSEVIDLVQSGKAHGTDFLIAWGGESGGSQAYVDAAGRQFTGSAQSMIRKPRVNSDIRSRSFRLFRRGSPAYLYCAGAALGAMGGILNNLVIVFLAAVVYNSPGFAQVFLMIGWLGVPLAAAMGVAAAAIAIWFRQIALDNAWGSRAELLAFSLGACVGTALAYYAVSLIVFAGLPEVWWAAPVISVLAGLAAYPVAKWASKPGQAPAIS